MRRRYILSPFQAPGRLPSDLFRKAEEDGISFSATGLSQPPCLNRYSPQRQLGRLCGRFLEKTCPRYAVSMHQNQYTQDHPPQVEKKSLRDEATCAWHHPQYLFQKSPPHFLLANRPGHFLLYRFSLETLQCPK